MHNLIAHALVQNAKGQVLIIRRTIIKRGKTNFEGGKWDIPGGTVEELEFPSKAAERETREEVNLKVKVNKILFEKTNIDEKKNKIFTTLIYMCDVGGDVDSIKLDLEEHDEYRWVTVDELRSMKDDELVSYMREVSELIGETNR